LKYFYTLIVLALALSGCEQTGGAGGGASGSGASALAPAPAGSSCALDIVKTNGDFFSQVGTTYYRCHDTNSSSEVYLLSFFTNGKALVRMHGSIEDEEINPVRMGVDGCYINYYRQTTGNHRLDLWQFVLDGSNHLESVRLQIINGNSINLVNCEWYDPLHP
jgi:hypothetical protein